MTEAVAYHGKLRSCWTMAADNCEPVDGRCGRCGHVHLRPTYCQALDPQNPWHTSPMGLRHKGRAVSSDPVSSVHAVDEAHPANSANSDRKAYMRELMRKRRASTSG